MSSKKIWNVKESFNDFKSAKKRLRVFELHDDGLGPLATCNHADCNAVKVGEVLPFATITVAYNELIENAISPFRCIGHLPPLVDTTF